MYIKKFLEETNSTKDTIRYYIDEKLLTPDKKGSWYWFTEKDLEDYENILALKTSGLSIKAIKKIKENRETFGCSTTQQWQENLAIITSEIEKAEEQIKRYKIKKSKLESFSQQLQEALKNQSI